MAAGSSPPPDPDTGAADELIAAGRLDIQGRLTEASNVTLFCDVELDGVRANAVYKPIEGERPLWDFPPGTLAGREAATRMVSRASGLGRVPPTVLRDGPLGPGMVQLWVDALADGEVVDVRAPAEVPDGWRVVLQARDRSGDPVVLAHADHPGVRGLAVLDAVVNNADRKGGHLLATPDGRVFGVDHGICFHTEPKLRTVLWGWVGEPLAEEEVEGLRKLRAELAGGLGERLAEHLDADERAALDDRAAALLAAGVFPEPGDDWHALPWPLF